MATTTKRVKPAAAGAKRTRAKARSGTVLQGKPGRRPAPGLSAGELIDQRVREVGGWRGQALARMRALILEADPDIVEEWKWSVPVWSHEGLVTTGEVYKGAVKFTFARGALLPDPAGLFNAGFGGNTRRAIDLREGDAVDGEAFKGLVRAAVALNRRRRDQV